MTATQKLPNWNLSALYSSPEDQKIPQDISHLEQEVKGFNSKYKGKIKTLTSKELSACIKQYDELNDLLGKLHSYSFLFYCTKVNDQVAQSFHQNTEEKINELTKDLIFFTLEINLIEESHLKELLNDESLKFYEPFIRDSRVWLPHQLSENEESIIHEKNLSSRNAWVRLFDQTSAKIKFPFEGKELTATEIFAKLSSSDAAVRKNAADSIGEVFQKNIEIFAFIHNTLIKDKELEENRRGFKQPIQSQNLSNLVEDEVVEALMKAVKASYPELSHRYYRIKAKMLGMEKLNYWDRNAALSNDEETPIAWNEAQRIVLDAYSGFSPKMAEVTEKFFANDWIDAEVKDGKMGGAFAHPTVPSAHPFVMLNYQGKKRDVMTLAHELGHGVHQVLAGKQGCLISRTPLTLAETASVFGEMLTFRSLIASEKDESKKKLMIASKVEDMLNTVVRQIAMCDFETKLHDARKAGELSPEQIGNIWYETQVASFGDSIALDDRYKNYWCYIPHFVHTPFYVYAYAFGDCLVNSLYSVYENKEVANFEDKYLEMLASGSRHRYRELLKPFNLDPSDPAFWQRGLKVISGFIDMLE
ncbi:MAG: M3 family oligoendopeptidase [Rickettsiales bacterium]